MCNVVTLPEGNPLDAVKGKKIIAVVAGEPLSFRLDDGKVLKLKIEQGPGFDLTNKPSFWATVVLDEKVLLRQVID